MPTVSQNLSRLACVPRCEVCGRRRLLALYHMAGNHSATTIVPTGMGFAKGAEGNLQLISGLPRMRRGLRGALRHAPLLVGASRKTFLGLATGRCSLRAVSFSVVVVVGKTESHFAHSLGSWRSN